MSSVRRPWHRDAVQPRPRTLTAVGLAVVALVVAANATGAVGFGRTGPALQVSLGTVGYTLAAVTFLLWITAPRWVAVLLLLAMGLAVTAIRAADPTGPVVGLFLIMAFAPLRLPLPEASAVAVATALLFNLEQMRTAADPALVLLVTDGGAAFFFLMGWLLRREREQRVELEATRDAERVAAALAERTRLAREVHDVLAHTLSALAVQLEGGRLLARSSGASPEVLATLQNAQHLARAGLAEARRAVATLRGDELPGPEAIQQLLDEHRRSGGTYTLTVSGSPVPLPADARLALFRTVQEALSNVRKHAPDSTAVVALHWRREEVAVVVENHWAAATVSKQMDPAGYGLTGIAERADLLGGRFTAGPIADGFRVELHVPVVL
jgi:signal transduction histidine kinase